MVNDHINAKDKTLQELGKMQSKYYESVTKHKEIVTIVDFNPEVNTPTIRDSKLSTRRPRTKDKLNDTLKIQLYKT